MSGQELKTKMLGAGYSVKAISDKMGMSMQALNTVFNVADVKTGFLERLCETMSLSMSFFYPDVSGGGTVINNVHTRGRNNAVGGSTITADNGVSDDNLRLLLEQNSKLIEMLASKK